MLSISRTSDILLSVFRKLYGIFNTHYVARKVFYAANYAISLIANLILFYKVSEEHKPRLVKHKEIKASENK